ncbi:MAG TPA: hypothetical protein VL282_13910 [Tepidisphaeraceae bacterium]|nr:hypothetical protein [Tepidisphaeraceae bacterium]
MKNRLAIALAMSILLSTCPTTRADDDYPIMSWETGVRSDRFSDSRNGLASLVDCGFTRAGFVRPDQLPLCEKLGIKAIVAPDSNPIDWKSLTDAQIDQRIGDVVTQSHDSNAVIGYFIFDEPGTESFPALAKAVAAVKKYAPGKLAYINLFPEYATLGAPNISQLGTKSYEEYLERFIAEVKPELISYDNYQIQYSNDQQAANVAASYYRNLLIVRRIALKHNLPFWNIVSCNQQLPQMPIPTPANFQLQAFTTLAAGADGLTWYTYYACNYFYAPINDDKNRTATWAYLKMVNDQVKVLGPIIGKLKSTGVYFTSPAMATDLPLLPGEITQEVKSGTPIMVGEFSGGSGERYVMLVNLSLERSTRVEMKYKLHQPAGYISPADGSLIQLDKDGALRLTVGQGALIKLK